MSIKLIVVVIVCLALVLGHRWLLTRIGQFPVRPDVRQPADAAVILNTGLELYPRLIEAARLYREELVGKVVINGNRKSETLRQLMAQGYQPLNPWYTERMRILEFLGVAGTDIIAVSAEDAYDTVSEAKFVGAALLEFGISSVIVTTSKFHTRRAGFIWEKALGDKLTIYTAAARDDPYDPGGWWRSGRQIRWLLAEYGAWLFYAWKSLTGQA